jgi:hypothetical protein
VPQQDQPTPGRHGDSVPPPDVLGGRACGVAAGGAEVLRNGAGRASLLASPGDLDRSGVVPLPAKVGNFRLVHGKFYVTDQVTNAAEVKQLAKALQDSMIKDNKRKLVWILSGTHGDNHGNLVQERKFFWDEDKQLEHQYFKAVDVFNFSKGAGANVQVAANSWNKYLGANAIIVLAWCFSKQSSEGWMKNAGLKV